MEWIYNWNKNVLNASDKIRISLDMEKTRFDNSPLLKYADIVFLGKDLAMHLGSQNAKSAVYDLRKNSRNG